MNTNSNMRITTLISMLVAIIIILGFLPAIPLGFIPIPIVLQNIGILIASDILGSKYGTITILIFLALAFVGLPILSGGRGGAAVFIGPTAGYIFGWIFTPLIIGSLVTKYKLYLKQWYWEIIPIIISIIFTDFCGALWLSYQSHMALQVALLSGLAVIPGDLIKSYIAILLIRRIRNSSKFKLIMDR